MRGLLVALLAVSTLLGLGFALVTPMGGAPDEHAHLTYVRHLATGGGLPALNLTQRRDPTNDPHYESHQPPLYYLLAVPFWHAGNLAGGDAGAGLACRLLNLLITGIGTWLIWLLARRLLPERPWLAVTAAAFVALLPMRLAIAASVSNDALTEACCTASLLAMAAGMERGWDLRRGALLGAALAAALLAKQSSILLLPPAALAFYLAVRSEQRPFPVRAAAAAAGIVLGLTGWWFLRNQLLYGDPLGQRAFHWYFADTPRWVEFRDAGVSYGTYLIRRVGLTTFASFWGAFGHLDPREPQLFMGFYPREVRFGPWGPFLDSLQVLWPVDRYPPRSAVYPLLVLATLAAIAGGILRLVRGRLAGAGNKPEAAGTAGPGGLWTVAGVHAALVFAAFLNFNATYFQGQGRYLFPALGLIAVLLSAGWLEWCRRREAVGAAVVSGGMLLLALYALFGVVMPGFARA